MKFSWILLFSAFALPACQVTPPAETPADRPDADFLVRANYELGKEWGVRDHGPDEIVLSVIYEVKIDVLNVYYESIDGELAPNSTIHGFVEVLTPLIDPSDLVLYLVRRNNTYIIQDRASKQSIHCFTADSFDFEEVFDGEAEPFGNDICINLER